MRLKIKALHAVSSKSSGSKLLVVYGDPALSGQSLKKGVFCKILPVSKAGKIKLY